MSKFTLYTDDKSEIRWKLLSGTDTVLARSGQGFKVKDDCLASVTLMQKEIVGATVDHEVRTGAAPNSSASAAVKAVPAVAPMPGEAPKN